MPEAPPNDPNLFTRVDAVIALGNEQMMKDTPMAVATSTAFASARLAIWATALNTHTVAELEERKAHAMDRFLTGYRAMLEDHFNEFVENYDRYRPAKPGVVTR